MHTDYVTLAAKSPANQVSVHQLVQDVKKEMIAVTQVIDGFPSQKRQLQYIARNMHTVFALLCFVVVIHWLIFPYPSGLLHWHCGNLTISPVPAKQPWWIWINTSCEFIMNDCVTTTKQSTTKPCAYFLGYTVREAFPWYAVMMKFRCPSANCKYFSAHECREPGVDIKQEDGTVTIYIKKCREGHSMPCTNVDNHANITLSWIVTFSVHPKNYQRLEMLCFFTEPWASNLAGFCA